MIFDVLNEIITMFLDMAPYMMLGLLFVAALNLLISKDMIVRHVGSNSLASVIKAALIGVPLPLCSCGVIPSAVYLANNGASKGAVVSFLISTPQTGIDSMIATYGMLGWFFAIFRPLAAFLMGIFGGAFFKFANSSETAKNENIHQNAGKNIAAGTKLSRIKGTINYAFVEFLDGISAHFVFGVIIAGLISYFIPDDFFANSSFGGGIIGMLIMILIGIPMYVCSTSSIPIAISLMMKGLSPGTAFVFMVTGPVTNAASITILSKALGKKTTTYYVALISVMAIAFGYLLDYIVVAFSIDIMAQMSHGEHRMTGAKEFNLIIGIIFLLLILISFYRKYLSHRIHRKGEDMRSETSQKILIEGMNCQHCVMTVKDTIAKHPGVKDIEVILNENAAFVDGDFNLEDVKNSIEAAGYKVVN